MAEMRWQIEPLASWPYPVTERPRPNPFRASWDDTLKLLSAELDLLKVAGAVALRVVADAADVRRDGMLRAHAKVGYRGVAISFTSVRHGALTYPCDTYAGQYYGDRPDWQINVRAIALGLQALRAVDRYGVAGRGEQYAGWRAITAGSAPFVDRGAALAWLRDLTRQRSGSVAVGQLLRQAAGIAHPDRNGGDRDLWDRYDAARQMFEGTESMTTTEAVEATATITCADSNALVGMLVDLNRTTDHNGGLPWLAVVRLHTQGGWLYGWSTDRFVAAHARVELGPDGGELPRAVGLDVTEILKAFRAKQRHPIALVFDLNAGKVTATIGAQSITVPLYNDVYPNVAAAISDELPESHAIAQFDPKLLAELCAITKRRGAAESLRIATGSANTAGAGSRTTAHVSVGEDYRAWLMPRYFAAEGHDRGSWLPATWDDRS